MTRAWWSKAADLRRTVPARCRGRDAWPERAQVGGHAPYGLRPQPPPRRVRPRDPQPPGASSSCCAPARRSGISQIVTAGTPSEDRTGPHEAFDETRYLSDLVPVDQFDFTNRPRFRAQRDHPRSRRGQTARGGRRKPGRTCRRPPDPEVHGAALRPTQRPFDSRGGSSTPVVIRPPANAPPARDHAGLFRSRRSLRRRTVRGLRRHQLPPVLLGAADPVAHPNQESFPIPIGVPGLGGGNPIGITATPTHSDCSPDVGPAASPVHRGLHRYAHTSARFLPTTRSPRRRRPPRGRDLRDERRVNGQHVRRRTPDPDDDPPPAGKTSATRSISGSRSGGFARNAGHQNQCISGRVAAA